MLRWLLLFEVGSRNERTMINTGKLFTLYALPTIISIAVVSILNHSVNLFVRDTLLSLAVLNLLYINPVHFYLQKTFFSNLSSDVILKFIPDKARDYINTRLLMFFLKLHLPILVPSLLTIALFIEKDFRLVYSLCSLAIIICVLVWDVLTAVALRYFFIACSKYFVQIFRVGAFIFTFALFILTAGYGPVYIMSNLEISLEGEVTRQLVSTNSLMFLAPTIVIVLMTFLLYKSILGRDSRNFKRLIISREYSYSPSKVAAFITAYFQRFYAFLLPPVAKEIYVKDVREIARDNRYSLFFITFYHIIGVVLVFFIHFSEVKSVHQAALTSQIVTIIVISYVIVSAFTSGAFKEQVAIRKDKQVLEKFNIKISMQQEVVAKRRLLASIVFPSTIFIFAILILSSLVFSNLSLACMYIFSAVQIALIKGTMVLWRVKSMNNLNNKSEVISFVQLTIMLILLISYIIVYQLAYQIREVHFLGHLVLILMTAVLYLFNSKVNISKSLRGAAAKDA